MVLGAFTFNIIPAFWIGVCYLRGTLATQGFWECYMTSWSIQTVVLLFWGVYKITKITELPY